MAKEYVVKSGDTLSKIAQNNATDLNTLVQLNDIIDPNKIQVGQSIKLPGNDYDEAVSAAKGLLEAGTVWGTAWWNVKNAVPDADNAQIDKDLNKEFWSKPGAYEEFTFKKKEPFSLNLDIDTGIAKSTPAFIKPDEKVEIVEPEIKEIDVDQLIKPIGEIISAVKPEDSFVTPEGRPYEPRKRPEDILPSDVGRSFFGGITKIFEDKYRKYGDKLDEMFRAENEDVFLEVRDEVAKDVQSFFEPMIDMYFPAYGVINKTMEGFTKPSIGNAFTSLALDPDEDVEEDEEKFDAIHEMKLMLKETDSAQRIANATKDWLFKGKPIAGLLELGGLFSDQRRYKEEIIMPIVESEKTKSEPWQIDLTRAQKNLVDSRNLFASEAAELENLGLDIKYDDLGAPILEDLGISKDIRKRVDEIYKEFDIQPDSVLHKNNESIVNKYVGLEDSLGILVDATVKLDSLDITSSAPAIAAEIDRQFSQLSSLVSLITDTDASVRQLNEYRSTYEEANKTQEQISNEMIKLQEQYDVLLDPDMIEYVENTQRVDVMSQAEFQAMQNYGYLNHDRINKMNDLAQKWTDAKTRLDINSLQGDKAAGRYDELLKTVDSATENLIALTDTPDFANSLTKYNLLSADQSNTLVQSLRKYHDADEWLRRNQKNVIDETIKKGDDYILAQAEIKEFEQEVSRVMDKIVKASSEYADAWDKVAEAKRYREVADLGHAADVAEAVEKKRYIFGFIPGIGGIMTEGPLTTNKEVMNEAFGADYTWADTQEVYFEYLKNRFGTTLETGIKVIGSAWNVVNYPLYKTIETFSGRDLPKPSEHTVQALGRAYSWWFGYFIPSTVVTASTLSDDLDWVGLPMDSPAGYELRNIGLPDDFKQGVDSLESGIDPNYKGTRGMRALMTWLNMPGPEDQQLLWTKWDKREVTTDRSGKLEMFIDPWDMGDEKRIEEIKKLNPHIKNFNSIPEDTNILLYKGLEHATEYMKKQDALINFMTSQQSEERFITDKTINIYDLIPSGEEYAETVGAVLDLNNFSMRGIDPMKIPAGEVVRIPMAAKMPELSNMINIKDRLELKSEHPIVYQLREEAFNFAFDPIDWLWYPAGKAVKPMLKSAGFGAYGKLASVAEKNAFARATKATVDLTYSIGRALKGTGPLPEHYILPKPENLKTLKDLIPFREAEAKTAAGKLALSDLLTGFDPKNPRSLATLASFMTKMRGVSLSKAFPYEIGEAMGRTDKSLNRLRAENEVLFMEAIQKVSQQTGESSMKIKTYIHEYIADPTHASLPIESVFWKFNEHMGLSEGRLRDMMYEYPDSYYDNITTTKVSNIKDLVSKEISNNPEKLAEIIEINNFKTLKIDPEKIPAGAHVITSTSNFFKELEKEIFRGKNVSKFELMYLTDNINELNALGRQVLIDFFQYWDPKKKKLRPIYNQFDLDKRIKYWREKYAKDAPEQKSIDKAIEVANFYRARTEYWAKVIEEKYAVPIKLSDDMEVYTITPDNFSKLTKEEQSIWDKNGMMFYTDPATGKMRLLLVHDTMNGLGGDLMQVLTNLKSMKMNNTKKMVIGSMENKWKKNIPVNHDIVETINSKTGEKEFRYVYYTGDTGISDANKQFYDSVSTADASGNVSTVVTIKPNVTQKMKDTLKLTRDGRLPAAKTVTVYSSLNKSTKGFVVSDVTANDLLHTAYLGKGIGADGKRVGWYHTLDNKAKGELSSILDEIYPDKKTKQISPKYSGKKDWSDKMVDLEYNPYDVHKGDVIDIPDERPDIDLVLTVATSLEDLYFSNKNFYDSLKGILKIVKENVDKKVVGYEMESIDRLVYFLMDLNEGAPVFFNRQEHHIIELILRGQDLTDVNIRDLLKSQNELGRSWSRSKQKKILDNREKVVGGEAAVAEKALRTEFRLKNGNKMNEFETLKEQLKMVPGMISVKTGGIAAKGTVPVFTDQEAANMFAKYGDASFLLANPRINREFTHLFSERVPTDLLPKRFTPITEKITEDALQAMAKISKMPGATSASVPLKITEAIKNSQDSRTFLTLGEGDITKREGSKLVKGKTIKELEEEIAGEVYLPLPPADIGQKALDKLNAFEKKAAQAKVDMTFAKEKLELTRKNKRNIITINRFNDAYKAKLEEYKVFVQEGKDYAKSLGDDEIQFIDRSRGKTVDPSIHEASEFLISPGLEKDLELVKIPLLDSGLKNPLYRHRFVLPLDSDPHRLLYEYLRTRDDFIEGVHFEKAPAQIKEKMTSNEIIKMLEGEELQSIIYLFTKRVHWKDGNYYGIPNDQVVKLVVDSIEPEKFQKNNFVVNAQDFKESLAKIELNRWDEKTRSFIPRKEGDPKITAYEMIKADVEINETDIMTTSNYTSIELAQRLEEQSGRTTGKKQTGYEYTPEARSGKEIMTTEDMKLLTAGDKNIYEDLVNDISDYNSNLGKSLDEWNTALYTLKAELGVTEFKPSSGKLNSPVKPGEQMWELENSPTGKTRSNTEKRMISRTDGKVIHEELLTSEVRKELETKRILKEKSKAGEVEYDPERFINNLGNVFDVESSMGPDEMTKWIDKETSAANTSQFIVPLQDEIQQLKIKLQQIVADADDAISAEKLKGGVAAKKGDASVAKEVEEKAIEKIKSDLNKEYKDLVNNINDKTNELTIIEQRSDGSVTRQLLRTDGPKGTLFDVHNNVAGEFVKETYADVESQIIKKKKQIKDIKKEITNPTKPEAELYTKPVREGESYLFDAPGKPRGLAVSERFLQLSNAKRELRNLESFKEMIIPWNLAKANNIVFSGSDIYWAGKNIVTDDMAAKMTSLNKLVKKRKDLMDKPDGLVAINIPRVTHPAKYAPSIDEADVRKVFYDKLPGIKNAKEVTVFKTDILEIEDIKKGHDVVDSLQKLLDMTDNEKNLPFIYDMTGKLTKTIKSEWDNIIRGMARTSDPDLRKEYRARLRQINLIQKKLKIVKDKDFLVENLKSINMGPGMSASLTEFNAIEKAINKMKERGSVWLFGEREAKVTAAQLKDSIYGKGMTDKSRELLKVMREDYDRLAGMNREHAPGMPYFFPKNPESITTRILGSLDDGKWTPKSLELSIKAISETAWKGATKSNFDNKIVKYNVGAKRVDNYNSEIKGKNVLVRSDKGTILSTDFKKTITNGINNDVKFFFPTVRRDGENSIYQFIKQFKNAKIRFIDAREANVMKMVNDKPVNGVVMDYLLTNQTTQSTRAMKTLYNKWTYAEANRLLLSPDRLKSNLRAEMTQDVLKYLSDPNKFPPDFIMQKAKRFAKVAGYPLQSVKKIVVDWKSIEGRQSIKKAWDRSIKDSIKIYRKELLENLKSKYAGKEIPKWHKEMVEKQVESLRISTEMVGDQVFKFDMPMTTWEQWYKNVSDKLFYVTELAAIQNGKDNELNFPAGVDFDISPTRKLMYTTGEWIMRYAPIPHQTLFSIGRTLKSVWMWSILLLQPGWSMWNSISDGVRAMVGARNIVAFVDMQRAFAEGFGHLMAKLAKDLHSIPGDIRAMDVVAKTGLTTKTGRKVSAQFDPKTRTIYFDKNQIAKDFENKAWTKPKVKGVNAYSKDAFKTVDEWENFVITHERLHDTMKAAPGETQASLENRINRKAKKLKDTSRYQVFDLTKIAEIERTEWNPLTSQKFRDAWLAKEKTKITPAGEIIDIDDWDHITSSGLTQVTADPERAAAHAKVLREDGITARLRKRTAVIKGDIEIFVSQMEEARRQIMAFNLIYDRAFTKAKANALVKKWLFDYRDLTLAGQAFRKFFPFYTFNAKSIQLYLSMVKRFGPGVYQAANGLLDAWEDATYDLPDQYKDRIQIGDRIYWLTRFGIQEYFRMLVDPWESLKGMVDNPLKVAFNFGWGPFSSQLIEGYMGRGFWETGPLMKDFESTGWTKEEIDRFKERDDARMYDDISSGSNMDSLISWLLVFSPPMKIVEDMFKLDVGFTLRGGSLLQSKKARSIMKFFGVNLLKLNEEEGSLDKIAYVFDRLRKLPPSKHYFFKKSLEKTDPELYNYFRQYQILSKVKRIMEAKDGKSKEEKIAELHVSLTIDTYYEKEFQKNGSGDAWLTQNPEFRKILDKHFAGITAKYGLSSGAVIGKSKYELAQVDASLRKMFEQIKSIDETRIKKMDAAGIDHPFAKEFDKQELRDALYNADGTRKFKTIDEAVAIVDQFDALIDLLEIEEYHAEAEKTYTDWQLMADAAKDAKRDADAKFYRRMGMLFTVIPDGIDAMPNEQAQVYWDKWRMLKETLIDSIPEYAKRYQDELPAWQKEYYAKNEEYMSRWTEIRKEEDEDDNFFEKFYTQPSWFQTWYFLKHPKKALYFPIVSDYTDMVSKLVKDREDTGEWDSVGFFDALNFVWGKQNALKAWDEGKPGVYNFIDKHRQVWDEMAKKQLGDEDTEDYFDLFYKNEGDEDWDAYREYYFSKEDNEYKRITYPFMRTWTGLFDLDEQNDTNFASDWFWSPNHAEARKLYGEHGPLEDGKNKLDYQTQWRDWQTEMTEDRGAVYDLVLNSEPWFKNEYWRNHPDRKTYYPLASEMQKQNFSDSLDTFFDPKNKGIIAAWENDKPGTIVNKTFWKGYGDLANSKGQLAALDFYFDPKNAEEIAKHEKNNPGANYAFSLWREFVKLPDDTWLGRKARRAFLRAKPELQEYWNRSKEISQEDREAMIKNEIYYTIVDSVDAEGSGRQYYTDYYKARAEAAQYLKDNPDLAAYRDKIFKTAEPIDKTLRNLQDEYYGLVLQEDKTDFLAKHPDLDRYLQNLAPPGIKKVRNTQKEYFSIVNDDDEKQRKERAEFLANHPELVEYWDVKNLPVSYYTDRATFEKYQTELNKANDFFDAAKSKDWGEMDKLTSKFSKFPPDTSTEEGRWLMSKLYREAMSTWATTFGSYMSTYYFRSLPSWLRNEYYRRNPEAKIISYTPMSRSLNNAVIIEDSKHPDLTWARRMMQKYGSDIPSSIDKQVQKIMVKWGEWDDRSTWTSKQWSDWRLARTARTNALRAKDLEELPLLRKELAKANRMFSYSMLPVRGSRKYGIINPFLGSPVLLPELTLDPNSDIININ